MTDGFSRYRPISLGATPRLVTHHLADPAWQLEDLKIAILSDLHVCAPWVSLAALARIVGLVNGLRPDLILLPGDFLAERKIRGQRAGAAEIAAVLADLSAPLGVWGVLGNHDWRDCDLAVGSRYQRNSVTESFAKAGLALLHNEARALTHAGGNFWLVGFDSQRPYRTARQPGFHRPDLAFATVPEGAPTILMAHEPDYFAQGDARAFLQISGHTHGGQMNLLGWRPIVPSLYRGRYGWGHISEGGRHLIVSGGIGYSGLPLRLFQPPEVTLVMLRGPQGQSASSA
ncbi:MAG: metallophosphoesterase [Paracoccaceae bacterium]